MKATVTLLTNIYVCIYVFVVNILICSTEISIEMKQQICDTVLLGEMIHIIFSMLTVKEIFYCKRVCVKWAIYSLDSPVWHPSIEDRKLIYSMRGSRCERKKEFHIARRLAPSTQMIELGSRDPHHWNHQNLKDDMTDHAMLFYLHQTDKKVQSVTLNNINMDPLERLFDRWIGLKHLNMFKNLWTNEELIKAIIIKQQNTLEHFTFIGDASCKKKIYSNADDVHGLYYQFNCTDCVNQVLHTFNQLHTLELECCSIDDTELSRICNNKDLQHSLTKLSLQECRTLTQTSLAKLLHFSNITELRLISISKEQLDEYELLNILKHLQNLVLLGTPESFSYQHMEKLNLYCPHLTQLWIGHHYFDSDLNGLQAMIDHPTLTYLEIAEQCPYNLYDLQAILNHLPQLIGISFHPPKAKFPYYRDTFMNVLHLDLLNYLTDKEEKDFENHYYNQNSIDGPLLFYENPKWLGSKQKLIKLVNKIIGKYEQRDSSKRQER